MKYREKTVIVEAEQYEPGMEDGFSCIIPSLTRLNRCHVKIIPRGDNMSYEEQLTAIADIESNMDVKIDQTLYPKPDWAVDQIVRSSGLVEDICRHQVGHPNADWLKENDPDGERGLGIHGCDGCCCDEETKKRIREGK